MQSPAKTGTKMRSAIAFDSKPSSSSCVSVSSPSRYFIISSSSASATNSHRWSWASSAWARYSSGISDSTASVPLQWRAFMRTRSMMPSKSSPSPQGRVTAPRRVPKRSCSRSIVVAKLASERDRRFTNTARARRRSSAAYQSLTVVGCGPASASTTNRAVSQTLIAAKASPIKSG